MESKVCKNCGSHDLEWQSIIVNRSSVVQGRLNTNDVDCLFFLGCNVCSETVATLSAEKVARILNASM